MHLCAGVHVLPVCKSLGFVTVCVLVVLGAFECGYGIVSLRMCPSILSVASVCVHSGLSQCQGWECVDTVGGWWGTVYKASLWKTLIVRCLQHHLPLPTCPSSWAQDSRFPLPLGLWPLGQTFLGIFLIWSLTPLPLCLRLPNPLPKRLPAGRSSRLSIVTNH